MKIILEYVKENPCDFGPDVIYKVIEVKDLTKKDRKKPKRKKVLEILTEVKSVLFDNGDVEIEREETTKWF